MNFAVAVFLLAAAVQVYARPDGAPADACPNIFPMGHVTPANQVPDITANPYQLSLQGFRDDMEPPGYRYFPGARYMLTITAPEDTTPFRGLLVQARLASDGTTPVGTFSDFTSNTEASACTPATGAVTHSNRNDKRCELLTWTAPPNGTGTIRFHYAVVREYRPGSSNMFYAPLMTTTIEESDEMPSEENPICGPCEMLTDTCDENAACTSETTDTFQCTCNPGFTGSGMECSSALPAITKALPFWTMMVLAIFTGLSHLL